MESIKAREAYVLSELEHLSAPSLSEEEIASVLRSVGQELEALGAPSAAFFDRFVDSVELKEKLVRVNLGLSCCAFSGVGSGT